MGIDPGVVGIDRAVGINGAGVKVVLVGTTEAVTVGEVRVVYVNGPVSTEAEQSRPTLQ